MMMSKMGIYEIRNIKDSKVYIGSSKNIDKRWSQHRNMLNNNKHHSRYLQNAWNAYGENIFRFSVLELVDSKDDLFKREQMWMNYTLCYLPENGYNMSKDADFVNVDAPKLKIYDKQGKVITLKDVQDVFNSLTFGFPQNSDEDILNNYDIKKGNIGVHRDVFMSDLHEYYENNINKKEYICDCHLYSGGKIYYHLKELCKYDFFHTKFTVKSDNIDLIEFVNYNLNSTNCVHMSKIIQYKFITKDNKDILIIYTRDKHYKIILSEN